MGKAAGYTGGRAGVSARAGAIGHYSFGRMPNVTRHVDLWKGAEEIRKRLKGYKVEQRRLVYERVGPLERDALAMAAIASVDYSGNRRQLYSANVVRGAGKGYGLAVRGDAYQTPNIVNFADSRDGMLDKAYKKIEGAGYQPNFEYSQAA